MDQREIVMRDAFPTGRPAIPFVAQPARVDRTCGACALVMVYRSLGIETTVDAVWQRVGSRIPTRPALARTHRLAWDAMELGLQAVVLQARLPWPLLQRCHGLGYRAILNHRLDHPLATGHFSVLVEIDDEQAVLHDPVAGPNRAVPREELLSLWRPLGHRSEISGYVLIAIDGERQSEPPSSVVPVVCPTCGWRIGLEMLHRIDGEPDEGRERSWKSLYCPRCDEAIDRVPRRGCLSSN